MSTTAFVIDTSYLLEFYRVPGFSTDAAVMEVRRRFKAAFSDGSRLFVPVGAVFEFANHVADLTDGGERKRLADDLYKVVASSILDGEPWIIVPGPKYDSEFLSQLCSAFSTEFVQQRIGLTDTHIIDQARRLKQKYSGMPYRVHIWTKDHRLKAYEPDRENDPFLG